MFSRGHLRVSPALLPDSLATKCGPMAQRRLSRRKIREELGLQIAGFSIHQPAESGSHPQVMGDGAMGVLPVSPGRYLLR